MPAAHDQPSPAPRFPAPWRVDSITDIYDQIKYGVRSHDHHVVIRVGEMSLADCEAVVRSRNEGTAEEDVASVQARWQAALDHALAETKRVRAHFHEECSILSAALDAARASGDEALTLVSAPAKRKRA